MSIMSYNGAAVIGACIRPRTRAHGVEVGVGGDARIDGATTPGALECARMRAFDACTRASHRYAPY